MKAISLLSGGLDSIVATKMLLDQGIEVEAVNYVTVFCNCTSGGRTCLAGKSAADQLGIALRVFEISDDFFEVIKNPKHGYGRNLNPCLDCRIYMFKKAGKYMRESGASFIATGEVLGERPMSQRRDAMRIIEEESGMKGLIVRPLSAKLFEPSIPEEKGWVDREKFLKIEGRCRKPQIELANNFGINDYPCPAGGCLLTDEGFARKFKDLMDHEPMFGTNDVKLLKTGRVFRLSHAAKLIVGRNEKENDKILSLARDNDMCFDAPDIPGPIGLGRGIFDDAAIRSAYRIIARYSDSDSAPKITVARRTFPREEFTNSFQVLPAEQEELDEFRL